MKLNILKDILICNWKVYSAPNGCWVFSHIHYSIPYHFWCMGWSTKHDFFGIL